MVVIVFVVVLLHLLLLMVSHCSMNLLMGNMTDKWAYTSFSVSRHIYIYIYIGTLCAYPPSTPSIRFA